MHLMRLASPSSPMRNSVHQPTSNRCLHSLPPILSPYSGGTSRMRPPLLLRTAHWPHTDSVSRSGQWVSRESRPRPGLAHGHESGVESSAKSGNGTASWAKKRRPPFQGRRNWGLDHNWGWTWGWRSPTGMLTAARNAEAVVKEATAPKGVPTVVKGPGPHEVTLRTGFTASGSRGMAGRGDGGGKRSPLAKGPSVGPMTLGSVRRGIRGNGAVPTPARGSNGGGDVVSKGVRRRVVPSQVPSSPGLPPSRPYKGSVFARHSPTTSQPPAPSTAALPLVARTGDDLRVEKHVGCRDSSTRRS
ncbi:hypothetical protein VOLCADRAFT_98447 [Volvox carteri f. nagariensis]|uniref:Uncharacterized protein n=1 Tax=Volvox carteri f. nagariensis TaxID=3068 RepID=D8UFD0_VOLCA|nr:uncharacterized protein VOLCADRAFT_98447 [Volvox carteri f. nagariensis]EFJ41553.1 hypothetical protein VOLCADRAFT_98447 [Volvox carteri f. nagariensis]|eukprot:XP_002957344.1 hypothetical protein VOLCADRAFT_98447 [Volvox carteri f. nagariensis]